MGKPRDHFSGSAFSLAFLSALFAVLALALFSAPLSAAETTGQPAATSKVADSKAASSEAASSEEGAAGEGAQSEDAAEQAPSNRPPSARSLAHLYELMVKEPPLTESDLAAYQKFAGDIVAMASNPDIMAQLIAASGWTESRLTYVAVKVGLGLTRLEDPNSPVLSSVPEFAWPTEEEALIIELSRDDLAKAIRRGEPTIALEPELEAGPEGQ